MRVKVTPAIMSEGRRLLQDGNLEEFEALLNREFKFINRSIFMKHIHRLHASGNTERAIRLFNVLTGHSNLVRGAVYACGKLVELAIVAGIIGGCIYFIKSIL